jgi:hypothetical protein
MTTPNRPSPVEISTTGNTVKIDPTANVVKVSEGVQITKAPPVTGSVEVTKTPPVAGSVEVTKAPPVTGSVEVTRMPAVAGSVEVTQMPGVEITELPPVTGAVAVTDLPPVTGSVAVTELPPVTGSVEITRMPAVELPPIHIPQSVTIDQSKPMPVSVVTTIAGGLAYAVTAAGGRTGYNASSGTLNIDQGFPVVDIYPPGSMVEVRGLRGVTSDDAVRGRASTANPAPVMVAVFTVPADAGVDAYIQRYSLGTSGAGEWIRYATTDPIEIVGEPVRELNRGWAAGPRSESRLYTGLNAHATSGYASKVVYTGRAESRDDEINGTIVIRPGTSVFWVFKGVYGKGIRASVEVTWWERPAAP